MRILLDESLPFELRAELTGQNLKALPVAVIVLIAHSNRIEDLRPLVPDLLAALAAMQPRTLVQVGG